MHYELLNEEELNQVAGGAAITLTAVLAILSTAVIAVLVYKLYTSKKGTTTIPGGWKFTWN